MAMSDTIKSTLSLKNAIFAVSLLMFVWLIWYFYTGLGGPSELATYLVPIALLLQVLIMHQDKYMYPWLPPLINNAIVVVYIAICVYAFYYFWIHYEQIAIYRQGSYTREDFIVGLLMFLLVMEISRQAHSILFWVNMVLVFYTLYGYLSPLDFFWHPGTTFYRVVTSSTVELATGIYGLYAQLSLTLIAAFLLLAAAARGFEAQSAMVAVMRRLAGRSRHTIPQTAVLASVSVGMVSGSGSANTAVTGSFTIPLMKRYGVPPAFAGAVETSASMGGLIMPPLMAVAGFLWAEFMGVPYWDVVLRGFAISFVYFTSLVLAVYLLSVRLLPGDPVAVPKVAGYDQVKTAIFFASIGYLIYLMGSLGMGALLAALYTAIFMFSFLLAAYLFFKFVRKDPGVDVEGEDDSRYVSGILMALGCLVFAYLFRDSAWGSAIWIAGAVGVLIVMRASPALLTNIRITIETHAEMASYLTVLLATLGIMIGLFTVTGFINRMGGMLLQLGEFHVIALVLMAWIFGWLVGAGLPPTATYIILAVIIVQPMEAVGINPWIAHTFAFLLAIWGELSPPTSLTAAVAARIAEASFMRTMWEALKLCLPLTFLSFAIFFREQIVTEAGWGQVPDTLICAIAIGGLTFGIFGRFVENTGANVFFCAALALLSLFVILTPDDQLAMMGAIVILPIVIFGVWRHRKVAPPKSHPADPGADGTQKPKHMQHIEAEAE
jgi:TRAP transporter 4TM/12TM fusion protein